MIIDPPRRQPEPMPPRQVVTAWVDGADSEELRLLQQVIHSRLELAAATRNYVQAKSEFGA